MSQDHSWAYGRFVPYRCFTIGTGNKLCATTPGTNCVLLPREQTVCVCRDSSVVGRVLVMSQDHSWAYGRFVPCFTIGTQEWWSPRPQVLLLETNFRDQEPQQN